MKSSAPTVPRSSAQPSLLDAVRVTGLGDELLGQVATRVRQRRSQRRRLVKRAAASALLIAVGIWAVPYFRDTSTVATPAASRQSLALSDGSQAELNAQTELKTDFRYGRRQISLTQGEAFFSVAKDPAHPFLVTTPAGTVRVTGTKFNVRLGTDGFAEVTLLEGAVQVEREGVTSVALAPNEQVAFGSHPSAVRTLSATEIETITAWRQGRLVLDGLTLGEACARISAYHGKKISVEPEVANLRPGGSCPLDDLPGFLEVLKATNTVQVLAAGDGSYRIIPR